MITAIWLWYAFLFGYCNHSILVVVAFSLWVSVIVLQNSQNFEFIIESRVDFFHSASVTTKFHIPSPNWKVYNDNPLSQNSSICYMVLFKLFSLLITLVMSLDIVMFCLTWTYPTYFYISSFLLVIWEYAKKLSGAAMYLTDQYKEYLPYLI